MAGEVVLDTAVVEIVADTEGLRRDLQRAAKEVQKVGREMQSIGREMTTALTLPIAGIGAAAFKAAADFETALTGIAKTVDAPASAIAELGESFRALSEEIPVSTNELAKLAELGGQLGIEVDNLEGFVETMAALGVSTNLSAEEAGTALARLANIMGTSQTDFDRLGSTIVDLGNNLATTEAEIVAFAQRMAGAGQIAGLTESDILAIGGALSSVGVEAEAGGTAVQKVLIDINTAVAQGNESLELFARTAGMSAQEFEQAWRADAGAAFVAFVEGLGSAGDNATTVLSELGLENQRLIRSFLSLANAGPLLSDAIGRASDAWRENTALTAEAARFYDRMAARLAQLRNQAVNVAAEFGQALAPGFEAAMRAARGLLDFVRDLVEAFAALPKWVRAASVAAAGLAAALGPAAVAFGAIAQTMGTLLGLRVAASIAGWAAAFAQMAVHVTSVASGLALIQATVGPLARTMATLLGLGLARSLVGWADALAGLVIEVRSGRDAMALFSAVAAPLTRIPMVAAITGWASAFASLAVQVRSVSGAFALLQAAIGPVGWVIAGLAALGAGLTVVVREFRRLQREAREAEEAMDQAAAAVANFNEESTRFALGQWGQALVEARAEVKRLEADMEQAIATAAMFDEPVSSGLQQELLEARQNVQALEKLVGAAANRWTQGFGPAVDESVRSVQELADEFQRIGIGGFDASELSGLVQLQSELRRIVQDTTAAEEDRIRATQILQQVTAEINRLRSNGKRDLQEEIDLLTEAAELGVARASDMDRLKALQEEITATLRAGVSDLERRVELRRQELQISEALAQKDDELRQIQRNLDIQQAAVAGNEELVRTLRDHDEVIRAVEKGYTDAQVAQLKHIQALRNEKEAQEEAAKAADEAARKIVKTLDFQAQLAAAQARAVGDELKARRILGEAAIAQQVAGFQELVDAGLASEAQLRAFAEALREDLARSLAEATSSLAIADAVAGGLISVADSMGLVQGEARRFARAITDILSSLQNAQTLEGGFDFSGAGGVASALGIVGGVVGLLSGLVGGGGGDERNAEARRRQQEQSDALQRATEELQRFADTIQETTRLQKQQNDAEAIFREGIEPTLLAGSEDVFLGPLIEKARELSGELDDVDAIVQGVRDAGFGLSEEQAAAVRAFVEALEEAERAFEREQAALAQNLEVRRLSALGLDEEAQALKDQIAVQEAITAGWTDANIAALEHVQALEAEERAQREAARAAREAAQQIRDALSFRAQLAEMRGDDPRAARLQASVAAASAIEAARELLRAGAITVAEFAEFTELWQEAIEEAEQAAIDAQAQRVRDFNTLLQSETAKLAGDDLEVRRILGEADIAQTVAGFRDLVEAGELTEEQVRELEKVLGENLTKSLREAAEAAREAAEAERFRAAQDLRSLRAQLLEVQGRDAEARALRNQIELLQAIEDGRSAEYIATLRQLQAAREHARQVEEQRKAQDELNRSIASTTTALNAPSGLRLSLHRWRAMLADGVDVPSEVQTAAQTASQMSRDLSNVEPMPAEAFIEPELRLIKPDPLLVEPELILGSGLTVGEMGGGQAATQVSNIRQGDTHIDESIYIENLTVPTAGSGESPEQFIAKVRHSATRVIRKGGADPLRKVKP